MARIRTIKPEFFRKVKLFRAEQSTGLPIRIAFAGLFTCVDREGRFRWEPEELKLDCLPHDLVDFSLVLEALEAIGSIVRYEVGGTLYGFIPSWHEHQVINKREAKSVLPPPPADLLQARDGAKQGNAPAQAPAKTRTQTGSAPARTRAQTSTAQARAPETHVHARGEGKGKEEEGKGREEESLAQQSEPRDPVRAAVVDAASENSKKASELAVLICRAFETIAGKPPPDTHGVETWIAKGWDPAICIAVVRELLGKNKRISGLKYFEGAIEEAHEKRRPAGTVATPAKPLSERTAAEWAEDLKLWKQTRVWDVHRLGPAKPDDPDCKAPDEAYKLAGMERPQRRAPRAAPRPAPPAPQQPARPSGDEAIRANLAALGNGALAEMIQMHDAGVLDWNRDHLGPPAGEDGCLIPAAAIAAARSGA